MLVLEKRTAADAGLLCRALALSSRSSSLEPRCPWAVAMTLPVLDCLLDERARSPAVRCLTKRDYGALPLAMLRDPVSLVAGGTEGGTHLVRVRRSYEPRGKIQHGMRGSPSALE